MQFEYTTYRPYLILFVLIFLGLSGNSQEKSVPDSLLSRQSVQEDSVDVSIKRSESSLDSELKYEAEDSIVFDVKSEIIKLYGNALVEYESIHLDADYIEIIMNKNTVFAKGSVDSTGKLVGKPVFKDGAQEMFTEEMRYNFKSKKGLIKEVKTQEGESFLHMQKSKKQEDNSIHLRKGKYTTCSLEEPHFHFNLSKAIVLPQDKIVSGPLNLVFEGVPTPLGLPFGYFPNSKKAQKGLLLPSYATDPNLGFGLVDLGFYWPINDYVQTTFFATGYTRGTWGVRNQTNYKKRYKYSGNTNISFNSVISGGESFFLGYKKSNDFNVRWNHTQDSKAHPYSTFNASVNFGSSSYFTNSVTIQDPSKLTNNNFSSNISFNHRIPNTNASFSTSASISQVVSTRDFDLTLPRFSFSSGTLQPFSKIGQNSVGNKWKWLKKSTVSYTSELSNIIDTKDTIIFNKEYRHLLKGQLKNGWRHNVNYSTSINAFKGGLIFTPNASYQLKLYDNIIAKSWTDTIEVTDTLYRFSAAQTASVGMGVNTTMYGNYSFKKGRVKRIRHTLTPRVSFTYSPRTELLNSYTNGDQNSVEYSKFTGSIYGGGTTRSSGVISFGIGNTIEMKYKQRKDTLNTYKKISLLRSLSFNSSYDLFKDSMNLAPLSISGNTSVLKGLNLSFNGTLDPYHIIKEGDQAGKKLKEFEVNETGQLFNFTNGSVSLSYSLNSKTTKNNSNTNAGLQQIQYYSPTLGYFDYSVPWNLSLNYSLNYRKQVDLENKIYEGKITQSLSFSGNFSMTPRWKMNFSSGIDLKDKKLTYTTIGVVRDLHCWQITFNWVPIGSGQQYVISIQPKAALLNDLKLQRRRTNTNL